MRILSVRPSPACLARQQRPPVAVPQGAVAGATVAWRSLHRNAMLCRSSERDTHTPEQHNAPTAGSSTVSSRGSVDQEAAATTSNRGSSSSSSSSNPVLYGVMAALASVGAAETLYLTATKLLNASVACPTSGCDAVLSSPYSQLFGVPLPLLGAAAYTAVALAAGGAASLTRSGRAVPSWLSSGLAAGVCCLATTSASLMYILQTQLGGASCVWCWTSAAVSGALFSSLVAGMDRRQVADAAGPGLGATAAALAVLYAGFGPLAGTGISNAAELELPYISPQVTTESSQQTLSLAHRLREAGAVMYGAFWCSHCYDQKQEFGAAAMAEFPYVECFPQGWKKGVKIADACEAAGVKAFPTWIINGNTTEGQVELAQLEQMMADAQGQGAAAQDSAVAAVTGQ